MTETSETRGLRRLGERLGVAFGDTALALRALTHRSASEGAGPVDDNGRLEFLGDAVLQLAVSELLYRLPEELAQGELTRFRSHLVSREALAEVGANLGLDEHLRHGKGLRVPNDSVIADGVEALLGALYLDAGFEVTSSVIARLLGERLDQARKAGSPPPDPKTALQEFALATWNELPRYELLEFRGQNPPVASVRVTVANGSQASGEGPSKKVAERTAAARLLEALCPADRTDGGEL